MKTIIDWDVKIFEYGQRIIGRWQWLDWLVIFLAQYLIYLIPIILIVGWFWSEKTKRVAFRAGLTGIVAWWGFSKLIAAFVPRDRPSVALLNARELLFHRPDHSFPSDHTAAIFAVAMMIRLSGHKKLGNSLFIIGILICITRVLAGVHFPLDVVAGVGIGLLIGILFWGGRRWIDRNFTEPFIKIMRKIKL